MNHYEITTIAGLLNDRLSKESDTRYRRHGRAVKPSRTRRRFAGKRQNER